MQLVYTQHARVRMKERKVSNVEIKAVLEDPEIRYTDKKGNPILVAQVGSRQIKVVLSATNSQKVITVGD